MLYLLKSATNNQFLQENLQILALPQGGIYTVRYAARWVAPEILGSVTLDEPVCLVLSDRPYDRLVPVRRGRVTEVTDEAGDLTLDVAWGVFVEEVDIDRFSEKFSDLGKRRYFVVRDPSPPLAFLEEADEDRDTWRRTVRALRVSPGREKPSKYATTVFLRPLPIIDRDGNPVPTEEPLQMGETYQQPLDYDAPDEVAEGDKERRILLEPTESNLQIPDSLELPVDPTGVLSFRVHPVAVGDMGLKLWVTPDRAQSTTLSLEYEAVEPAIPEEREKDRPPEEPIAPPGEEVALSDRDLRTFFEVVEAEPGGDQNRALLHLIDHTLTPFAPDSHFLREQRGLVLHRLEQWQEAHRQFSSLDPDRLRAPSVVAWFVSACRAGIDADFEAILEHFDAWDHRGMTDQLIDVLPMVSEKRRLQLLQNAWLGAGRYRDVWDKVKDTFSQPAHILKVARWMVDPDLYHILSPAEGCAYLSEQIGSPGDMPLDMLEQAVEWGLEERDRAGNLGDLVLELVDRLLQLGRDPLQVWQLVEDARDLSPYVWSAAAEKLADALAGHSQADWRAEACRLYVDLARVQREQLQDVDAAGGFLIQAHHLTGDNNELVQYVDAEEEKWEAAVRQLESVQQWHDGLLEVRLERLREQLSGKRAVFVGGVKRGFDAEEVRRELGLAEADFVPHFHSERGSLDKVRHRIHQGNVDYVIDFVRFGAHRDLDGDCEGNQVTYVRVPRSRSLTWIVRALAKVHGIELN